MDALSGVLSLLNINTAETTGLKAGGEWAVQFQNEFDGVKFVAIVYGTCLLRLNDQKEPTPLKAGDCFLLFGNQPFWLGSDANLKGTDGVKAYVDAENCVAQIGDGDEIFLIGGRFTFDAIHANLLLPALPPFVHIPAETYEAFVLRGTLDQLFAELSTIREGHSLMLNHLGHILFVQVLRAYLKSDAQKVNGWLTGLTDPNIGSALRAIHQNASQRWTLIDLAKEAGMSRTNFARRFKSLIGTPPLNYLIKWRMQLAAKEFVTGKKTISEISSSLGYESESAFSAAFKRVMGMAPKFYKAKSYRFQQEV